MLFSGHTTAENPTRKSLKRQLIEAEQALGRYQGLIERKSELDAERNAAADQHATETAPLQTELKGIEDAIVARVADRLDADPALEVRRKKLLADIEECNVALQKTLDDINMRTGLVNREILAMAGMPNRDVILGKLYQHGDPDKRARCEAMKWLEEQLRRVCTEANKQAERFRSAAADMDAFMSRIPAKAPKSFSLYSPHEEAEMLHSRLKQWEVTASIAGEFRDEMRNEAIQLRQQIIEE